MSKIRAKILVEHGNADEFVPKEQIARFQEALETAGADWQMVVHGGAKHSFTNPSADGFGIPGLKYDQRADRRAWRHMELFLKDVFLVTP